MVSPAIDQFWYINPPDVHANSYLLAPGTKGGGGVDGTAPRGFDIL